MVPQPEQGGELQKRQKLPERVPEGVTERVAELGRADDNIDSHRNRLKGVLDGLEAIDVSDIPVIVDDNRVDDIKARAAEIALQRGNTQSD